MVVLLLLLLMVMTAVSASIYSLSILYVLSNVIFITIVWRHYFFPFIDKEQRVCSLPWATQLESGRAGIRSDANS